MCDPVRGSDAGVRSPAPGELDACGPAAASLGTEHRGRAACPLGGGPTPLVLPSHPEGSPTATVLGWSQQVQVKGERALAGPLGRGPCRQPQGSWEQRSQPTCTSGDVSLCLAFPLAGLSPAPCRPPPSPPPGTPPLPANPRMGWTPELSWGPGCEGQDASPAPSPPWPCPRPGASLGSSLFTATRGRNQADGSPSGRRPGTRSSGGGLRGEDDLRESPFPAAPSAELNSTNAHSA